MTYRYPNSRIWVSAVLLAVTILPVIAKAASDDVSPILEFGPSFHTGSTGNSLSGATGMFVSLKAERKAGYFRPQASAVFNRTDGNSTIGDAATPFNLTGVGFHGGVSFCLFPSGRLQPFIGGSAGLTSQFMKLDLPPAGVQTTTQGLTLGYEIHMGTDVRFGSSQANALRLYASYYTGRSALGGQDGFQLDSYRLMIGWIF